MSSMKEATSSSQCKTIGRGSEKNKLLLFAHSSAIPLGDPILQPQGITQSLKTFGTFIFPPPCFAMLPSLAWCLLPRSLSRRGGGAIPSSERLASSWRQSIARSCSLITRVGYSSYTVDAMQVLVRLDWCYWVIEKVAHGDYFVISKSALDKEEHKCSKAALASSHRRYGTSHPNAIASGSYWRHLNW